MNMKKYDGFQIFILRFEGFCSMKLKRIGIFSLAMLLWGTALVQRNVAQMLNPGYGTMGAPMGNFINDSYLLNNQLDKGASGSTQSRPNLDDDDEDSPSFDSDDADDSDDNSARSRPALDDDDEDSPLSASDDSPE
jgi:hypothetical protein